MRIRRSIATVLAAVATATGAAALAAPAAQAAAPCVTRAEYRALHEGMTIPQVRETVGARGTLAVNYSETEGDGTYSFTYEGKGWDFPKCRSFDKGKGKVGVFSLSVVPEGEAPDHSLLGKARSGGALQAWENAGIYRIR